MYCAKKKPWKHTLQVSHAADNLNSGCTKYTKVACMHYFCTIALRTPYVHVSVAQDWILYFLGNIILVLFKTFKNLVKWLIYHIKETTSVVYELDQQLPIYDDEYYLFIYLFNDITAYLLCAQKFRQKCTCASILMLTQCTHPSGLCTWCIKIILSTHALFF